MQEFEVAPDPSDPRLTRRVRGIDQDGARVEASIVVERPLTLFLNGQEIVTMMTIGDHPEWLAIGYLVNQNMLRPGDEVTGVDHDEETESVVVRTRARTDFEEKLRRKTLSVPSSPTPTESPATMPSPIPAPIPAPIPVHLPARTRRYTHGGRRLSRSPRRPRCPC